MKQAVIFDLDGTLLDTLEDLRDSLNYALSDCGYPTLELDEVRKKVGDGLAKLVERAVPEGTGQREQEKVLAVFKPHYAAHCRFKTRPYPGVMGLLEALKGRGMKLAIVSNKADEAVKTLSEDFFPGLMDFAVGEKAGVRRKPAPDTALEAMKALDVTAAEAVYVGDSEVDLATAQNAALDCVAVSWGFREEKFLITKGAKNIAHNCEELKEMLLK